MTDTIFKAGPALNDALAGATAPEACRTMTEVRAGIDALDQRLIALLALRQKYIEAAARIKSDRSQIFDAARVEAIMARIAATAKKSGLSTAIAEPVWRTLIDQCIAHEFACWDAKAEGQTGAGEP